MGKADKAAKRVAERAALGEDLGYLGEKMCALVQLCEAQDAERQKIRCELARLDNAVNLLRGDVMGILNTLANGDVAKIRQVADEWRAKDKADWPQTDDDIPF